MRTMPGTRQSTVARGAVALPAAPRVFVPLIQTPSERLPPQVIRVAHQLMLDIVAERYKPGEWIREQEVASRLSCSRAPVREALRLIEIDGLIEMVPWRGARVVTLLPLTVATASSPRNSRTTVYHSFRVKFWETPVWGSFSRCLVMGLMRSPEYGTRLSPAALRKRQIGRAHV